MERVGEAAYLLHFAGALGVLQALRSLDAAPLRGVRDLVPGARSLLVETEPPFDDEAVLVSLDAACELPRIGAPDAGSTHEIAVRYDGIDLPELAAGTGLSVASAVALHAGAEYRVAFVGFQPGFAYLAGLPVALHSPRLATPRPRVPAGSLAIGGEWTGIYPASTPGGWRLIGTTEVSLFDPLRAPPCLFAAGDRVRFVPR